MLKRETAAMAVSVSVEKNMSLKAVLTAVMEVGGGQCYNYGKQFIEFFD